MAIAPGEGRPREILSAMVPAAVIDPASAGPMSGRLVVDLFADLLSFIRTEALDRLLKQTGSNITDDKICWVLTVPAIWDDAAKTFMRHAAVKAVSGGERFVGRWRGCTAAAVALRAGPHFVPLRVQHHAGAGARVRDAGSAGGLRAAGPRPPPTRCDGGKGRGDWH